MSLLPDIPRLYTALAEWLAVALIVYQFQNSRKKHYGLNLLLMGVGQVALQLWVGTWGLQYWVLGMILNVAWMYATLFVTLNLPLLTCCYNLCKGFIFAEFLAAISWQLYCYFFIDIAKITTFELPFMLICYVSLSAIYLKIGSGQRHQLTQQRTTKRETTLAAISAVIIFAVSNLGFVLSNTVFTLGVVQAIFTFRTLVNLCGLLILYIEENSRYNSHLRHELRAINNVVQFQHAQYKAYEESSALIHQKFHDLKHQLTIIEAESQATKRKAYVTELKKDLMAYQAAVKTGNPVVDTILTEKNRYCLQKKISLSCLVNGKVVNFMATMDLCSLLGNALDNAIESVLTNGDVDKRLIKLQIDQKANFIVFNLTNYCETPLTFEDGLPMTTKSDEKYHGYGLKSIRYIAQKYNGTAVVNLEDNWFTVKVLLPLPAS
ncbi:hypothetical protein FC83_GL000977 [Agrilactobacillus composti DSM 18527 = JCM 14202]|uniref:Sensor histidine kinase NatK-like C-terminal domain-containing protein n=1 Tax=Agrilactobacillus composti DSM 18527 = JCM 14202 TaxID=1423734 RepID=X0PUE6_9LACO|nr:sensor histidine kinase [Agrilactobacillus composti]KRM35454.1 hypothetical protein FC83_GL000977 [Agrilactobacillus composti DSM 18527 = JCM 14202]GAF40976.1 hypothetical protein JCM14202_2890 [Agrilactobacillus composti DSM 18527 = JCM 14202]